MRWVHGIGLAAALTAASVLLVWKMPPPAPPMPAPTPWTKGEAEGFSEQRAQWIEKLHRHAPGLNWRAQDVRSLVQLHARRAVRVDDFEKSVSAAVLASAPAGTWIERGANNWAGRVSDVDYDAATDRLTVFAHGGQLWQSTRAALQWQPLNDARHFEPYFGMQHFVRLGGATQRWLVADDTRHGFFYSDDQGVTWKASDGFVSAYWLQTVSLGARDVAQDQVYALVEDYDFATNAYRTRLLSSADRGASFSDRGFVGAQDKTELIAMGQGSGLVYLLKGNELVRIEADGTLTSLAAVAGAPAQASSDRIGLAGGIANGMPFLYAFFEAGKKTSVFQSLDGGNTWSARGTISDVSLFRMAAGTDLHDPNHVYFGTNNLWRSSDAGATFSANDWAEYYDDPQHKLHADISFVKPVATNAGHEMLLIGTDGGLYESLDHAASVTNLNLTGMRQAQYYDSYTQRMPPYAIAVGAQDQGYQRNSNPGSGVLDFAQLIAGDYAQLTSGDGGATIWSVYPGFAQVDPAPADAQATILPEWQFEDDGHLQGMAFLPPLLADPVDPHRAWLAGGATTAGVNHVVQLTWHGTLTYSGAIGSIEGSFDFGGQVTALASGGGVYYALADAGDRAVFFRSTTPLTNWTRGAANLPQGHYFYGNDIAVDALHGKIYVCGSGYSGPPVYVSSDDGASFAPMATGLPNTMVYNLALSPDGSALFAATEVGPFYYDQANAAWVDIGAGAPDNRYWGVDYIPALNVARFATYGRGLWDYQMPISASMPVYPAASGKPPCDISHPQCWRVKGPPAHGIPAIP